MRPMDLDPTYLPYLEEARLSQPAPIREQNVLERRARMAALRREKAEPLPGDVHMCETTFEAEGRRIKARVYRPSTSGPHPCVVHFHGGGWMYGSPEQSQDIAVRICRGARAAVVVPRYRLSPEHVFPAAFEDCLATLYWAMDSARDLDVDSTRFAVMGESSGGNLAAACAIAARDAGFPGLRLQVLNYPALGVNFETDSYRDNADAPILDRGDMIYFWHAYLGGHIEARDAHAIPLAATDLAGVAPAFIQVAEYDPLRDDGVRYAHKLKAAGVPVDLRYAHRLPHGFLRAWNVSADASRLGNAMISVLLQTFALTDQQKRP